MWGGTHGPTRTCGEAALCDSGVISRDGGPSIADLAGSGPPVAAMIEGPGEGIPVQHFRARVR